MSDLRRNDRMAVQLEVEVNRTSDHNFYTGFTQNISEGGLFVATNFVQPVGTELSFKFLLEPDLSPVELKGIVRWVREPSDLIQSTPGMGVQFIELTPILQDRINTFISSQRDTIFFDAD